MSRVHHLISLSNFDLDLCWCSWGDVESHNFVIDRNESENTDKVKSQNKENKFDIYRHLGKLPMLFSMDSHSRVLPRI